MSHEKNSNNNSEHSEKRNKRVNEKQDHHKLVHNQESEFKKNHIAFNACIQGYAFKYSAYISHSSRFREGHPGLVNGTDASSAPICVQYAAREFSLNGQYPQYRSVVRIHNLSISYIFSAFTILIVPKFYLNFI